MKNLLLAAVVCVALMAMTSSSSAQCGRSYGYGGYGAYYAPAPVVVVPSYSYRPVYYGYGGYPSYGYRSSYYGGGFPANRSYYRGGAYGYGYGWGYPRSGVSVVVGW